MEFLSIMEYIFDYFMFFFHLLQMNAKRSLDEIASGRVNLNGSKRARIFWNKHSNESWSMWKFSANRVWLVR